MIKLTGIVGLRPLTEAPEDKYVHIGYGKYKEKGKEKDSNAPTFKKDDNGKFVPIKGADTSKKDDTKAKPVNIFDKPKPKDEPKKDSISGLDVDTLDGRKSFVATKEKEIKAITKMWDDKSEDLYQQDEDKYWEVDAIIKPYQAKVKKLGNELDLRGWNDDKGWKSKAKEYDKAVQDLTKITTQAIQKYISKQDDSANTDTSKVDSMKLTSMMPKADKKAFSGNSDINKIPDPVKREISMKIDKLAELTAQAKEKGEAAPNYNLCKITVPGTNLYCEKNAGIPREEMPQFKGTPTPGSPASKMKTTPSGEVDTEPVFRKMLKDKGIKVIETEIPSDTLKATQSELVGAKVAGMVKALEKDPNNPGITAPIYVSRDGYVVDGHHRWAAVTSNAIKRGEPANMKVIVIDKPIKEIIPMANKFAEDIGVAVKKADANQESPVVKQENKLVVKENKNMKRQFSTKYKAAKGGVSTAGNSIKLSELLKEDRIDNIVKSVKNGYGWIDADYVLTNPHFNLEDGEKAVALLRLAKAGMLVDTDKVDGTPEGKEDIPRQAFMKPTDVVRKYRNLVKSRYDKQESVKEASGGFPDLKKWWTYEPDEIMQFVYWQKRQVPPTDDRKWALAWRDIEKQLQNKFPKNESVNEGPLSFIKNLKNKIFKKKNQAPEMDDATALKKGKYVIGIIYDTYMNAYKSLNKYNDAIKQQKQHNLDAVVYNILTNESWEKINKISKFNIKAEVAKLLKNESEVMEFASYDGWLLNDIVEGIWEATQYKEDIGEHILNESDDLTTANAKIIAKLTGTRWERVEDFFYDHNIDNTIVDFLKKGSLKDRRDFATALSGYPNNKYLQFFVKKFGRK